MNYAEITELLSRLPDGGVVTDRTRYDYGYLQTLANIYRARLIRTIFMRDGRINPVCYQKYYPTYDVNMQDNPLCVKFSHPEVISLDTNNDGFRYIGTVSNNKSFARMQSRSWVSTFNLNAVTAQYLSNNPSALYDGNNQIVEVYGLPELKHIMTECLLADPRISPFFNIETDQFPLNDDLIPDLIAMCFSEEIGIESSKAVVPGEFTLNAPKKRRK